MSTAEQRHELYLKQKALLDTFLEKKAITKAQYDKSLHDLTEKMGEKPPVDWLAARRGAENVSRDSGFCRFRLTFWEPHKSQNEKKSVSDLFFRLFFSAFKSEFVKCCFATYFLKKELPNGQIISRIWRFEDSRLIWPVWKAFASAPIYLCDMMSN